jgi:hypothetical protein
MPFDPNANWTAATNAGAKDPVYYIALEGLASKHYATAPVKTPAVTKKLLLNMPTSIGQKVSQLQGRTSLNLFPVSMVNQGAELNDLFATEKTSPTLDTLINKRVTLFSGYASLAEADYAALVVGQIRDVAIRKDGTLWEMSLVDLRRAQQETIFLNADARGDKLALTFLTDYVAGLGVFKVTGDPTIWQQGDRIYLGPSTDAANPGAEEKVTVQQVRDGTNEVFINPVTTYKYKAGDGVRSASTYLAGNPYNVMLAVLTGDFANGSWPLLAALGQPTGLDIATADIDTTEIIKERDRIMPSDIWIFEQTRPISGSRFLESMIYRWLGYPRVRLGGKLSFRAYRPPHPDEAPSLTTIAEADVISWEAGRDIDSHVNRVVLGVDTGFGGGNPSQIVTTDETSDQTLTDEAAEQREESTGLAGAYSGTRLAQGRASVQLRRFIDGPYQVTVTVLPRKRAIEVGDDVILTHSRIPNPASSTPGVTSKRMEVVGRDELLDEGPIKLLLQDANWTRPFWIGPSGGLPDYDAASSAQREYGYIGPSGGGNFSDGTPGYEIQ